MKKLAFLLPVLLACTLFGCSTLIYSHKEKMETYKTKQDVLKTFGLPAQQKEGSGVTEWLYDFTSVNTKQVKGKPVPSLVSVNASTATVTGFTNYKNYIKFTIDAQGNVIKWESHGVDIAMRQPNTVGTVLLILLAFTVVLATALVLSGINYGL